MSDVTGTFYAGDAFVGYGSQLLVGMGDSPETFIAVADVMSIKPGAMTTGIVEKTHLRSPNRHKEKLATIRDSGPFTLSGNWVPSHGSQSNAGGDGFLTTFNGNPSGGLIAIWRNVEERNFIIRTPAAVGIDWPFRGTVTNFTPGELGVDKAVDFSCEITPLQDFSAQLP